MRIAIFGGTFDPIHHAHLAIARRAADAFRLDRVLFMPASHPPHKGGLTHAPYEDRVRMVELACAGDPRFEVSRLEQNTVRSYSIDSIEKLRARISPEDELFFIIGADAFGEIRTWYRWEEVTRAVCFIVVSRPGHRYEIPPGAQIERLDTLDFRISSSDIRRALASGKRPSADVPAGVLQYIQERGLYGARA